MTNTGARKKNQFYFSSKHSADSHPHKCFVTIDGDEREYTEWQTDGKPPCTHLWGDVALIGELDDTKGKIRVENAPKWEEF